MFSKSRYGAASVTNQASYFSIINHNRLRGIEASDSEQLLSLKERPASSKSQPSFL